MLALEASTVIPSVRRLAQLDKALPAPSPYILLSNTHIGNLGELSRLCQQNDKQVLVHVDLIGGFKPDRDGMRLLRNMFGVFGVFTQSAQVVAVAQKLDIKAIYRLFAVDSRFLERGLQSLNEVRPDGIEILPGAIAKNIADQVIGLGNDIPKIAGGFITTAEDAQQIFDVGYRAITSSTTQLWQMSWNDKGVKK